MYGEGQGGDVGMSGWVWEHPLRGKGEGEAEGSLWREDQKGDNI